MTKHAPISSVDTEGGRRRLAWTMLCTRCRCDDCRHFQNLSDPSQAASNFARAGWDMRKGVCPKCRSRR